MARNVLVTGADGFIGSHLVELLVKQGDHVKALTYYNSFNNWGWLEDSDVLDQIEVISGDIRDSNFCQNIVRNVDVVFNLAALIGIPYSYSAPQSYIDTNITGTLNLCSASLKSGVSKFIQTSTSEVYGTAIQVPISESHPLQPQSPYSASKIGSDSIALSFYNSFQLPVVIARPFNTYGPRQSARAVIPTIIGQLAKQNKSLSIGDLNPTRDFTYVEDTSIGINLLSTVNDIEGEVFNIGSNFEISIGDLVKKISKLMQIDINILSDNKRIRPPNSEVFRLWCDNSKLVEKTNFMPKFSLDEGLKMTIDWFSDDKNLSKYKTSIYNI